MPRNDYFAQAAAEKVLKTPAAVAADSKSAGVDIRAFTGKCMVVAAICNTAGATPTMDVKLQAANDGDLVGAIDFTGSGNGTLTEVLAGPDTVEETITITFSSATAFAVTGSVTGSIGSGTVGTKFTSQQIEFLVSAGSAAFANAEAFTIAMSARAYTDVPGGAFTQVVAANSIQKIVIDVDGLGPFLRLDFKIAGTSSPSYIIGATLYGLQGQ